MTVKANKNLSMIVAVSDNGVIGKDNSLPWPRNGADMAWFFRRTENKIVIMGSKTWHSLPAAIKPLKHRVNIVLSTTMCREDDVMHAVIDLPPEDISGFLSLQECIDPINEFVVIGGANVYKSMFPYVSKIYLSRIKGEFEGDTYLDIDSMIKEGWIETFSNHSDPSVSFHIYERQQ